jgi:hypothetical protein
VPSQFQLEEARRQERRDRERERERREERREALREQAREEEREREREEQARLDALEQARAYAADDERRRQRHVRTVERLRQERRAQTREEERQLGRSVAAREAARAVRRALGLAEAAGDARRAARRNAARAAVRAESREETARAERRAASREEARQEGRAAERRDAQRAADRASERAVARADQARAERRAASREERLARERAEGYRAQQLAARRESSRVELRAQERAQGRAQQRAQERATARRRDLAARHRSERSSQARAAPSALRVLGPLLLDAQDQPVRLRGVELLPMTVPPSDVPVVAPVSEDQLDELVRWGATALAVPVGLDDLLSPPAAPVDPALLPEGAVEIVEAQGPPDERMLSALEAHVSQASSRGLLTVLQLGPLRPANDDRPVDMEALRLFWRTLAERFEGEPSVIFSVLPGPSVGLHPVQFRIITLALIGEVRSVSPGAVVLIESPDGGVPAAEPQLHGLLYGARVDGDLPAETLAAVATRARTAPVLVVGWGDRERMPPQDAVGRRLASVGAHWLAAGWPQPASLDVPGRLRPTAAGSSVTSSLGNPDRPVGTSRTDGRPAELGRPTTLGVGGGGGGPGILGLPGMLAQLLIAAVPGPSAAGPSFAPPLPASRYLPSAETVLALVKPVARSDRATVIGDIRDDVLVHWNACDVAGLIAVLKRVRTAENAALTALPTVPAILPGIAASRIVPTFLRERLMLDGRAKVGADLVIGAMTPSEAAATPASTTTAVLSLRQLDDVLSRALAVERAAVATGGERALVLALYRVEGGLGMPPSAGSIGARIPSGTANESSSLSGGADISQLVWVSNTKAVTTLPDAGGEALISFVLQLAGLDVISGKTWAQYQQWTRDTWAAGSGSAPDPAGAAARVTLLKGALTVVKTNLTGVAGSDVFVAAVRDPIALTATALGDGVQLLRANRSVASFFGVAHLPAGAPTDLSEGMAYLRYNAGDEQARSVLASAVLAAAGTTRAQWAGLRTRIDAAFRAHLTSASAAGDAATSGLTDRREIARLRSEAVWPVMEPWLERAGNLAALEEFVNQAGGDEWSTGWFAIRANVARFRVLLAYYRKLFAPPPP